MTDSLIKELDHSAFNVFVACLKDRHLCEESFIIKTVFFKSDLEVAKGEWKVVWDILLCGMFYYYHAFQYISDFLMYLHTNDFVNPKSPVAWLKICLLICFDWTCFYSVFLFIIDLKLFDWFLVLHHDMLNNDSNCYITFFYTVILLALLLAFCINLPQLQLCSKYLIVPFKLMCVFCVLFVITFVFVVVIMCFACPLITLYNLYLIWARTG